MDSWKIGVRGAFYTEELASRCGGRRFWEQSTGGLAKHQYYTRNYTRKSRLEKVINLQMHTKCLKRSLGTSAGYLSVGLFKQEISMIIAQYYYRKTSLVRWTGVRNNKAWKLRLLKQTGQKIRLWIKSIFDSCLSFFLKMALLWFITHPKYTIKWLSVYSELYAYHCNQF